MGGEVLAAILARCQPAPHWTSIYEGAGSTVLRMVWATGEFNEAKRALAEAGALRALETIVTRILRRRLRLMLQAGDPLLRTLEERTVERTVEEARKAFRRCRYRTEGRGLDVLCGVQLEGKGWSPAEPHVTTQGRATATLVLPRAWLAKVWARGAAIIDGLFVLDCWQTRHPWAREKGSYHIITVYQSRGPALLPWKTWARCTPWRVLGWKEFDVCR